VRQFALAPMAMVIAVAVVVLAFDHCAHWPLAATQSHVAPNELPLLPNPSSAEFVAPSLRNRVALARNKLEQCLKPVDLAGKA
jgi:hypothetical protein